MKRFPCCLLGLLLLFGVVEAQGQKDKTDYAVAVKLKALDGKEAKLRAELFQLRDQTILDTDPVALERKKIAHDSMIMAVKSKIIAVRLEREEIKAKRNK